MESLCLTPGFDLSGFSFLLMGNYVFRVFAAEITKVKRSYSELVSISPASSVLKSVFANQQRFMRNCLVIEFGESKHSRCGKVTVTAGPVYRQRDVISRTNVQTHLWSLQRINFRFRYNCSVRITKIKAFQFLHLTS